ncbi:MAG: hypothetical protein COA85_08590 [Robiginitomaculum sp.]|nr:MAG: hypothetical protein COA85_08590 [Robiginitomaculum sp.]
MTNDALIHQNDALILRVRLQPKSSIDQLEGLARDAAGRAYLKARVRAIAEKGKANTALEKLIAKAIHVPRSTVSVIKGNTNRIKTVRIEQPDKITETALRALLKEPLS